MALKIFKNLINTLLGKKTKKQPPRTKTSKEKDKFWDHMEMGMFDDD